VISELLSVSHDGHPQQLKSLTMQDHKNADTIGLKRVPWNKGKLIGAKPPLRPKHVWSIRTKLQIEGQTRELAMFNLAIDSKFRGCDLVALKVEDVRILSTCFASHARPFPNAAARFASQPRPALDRVPFRKMIP
jgi:hypothetical protein